MTSLLSPSRTGGDKQNRRARKLLCWHCVWTSQGELIPGVGEGGYYANLIATASSRTLVDLVFHVFLVVICCQQLYQGGCLNWYGCGCTLGRKVWCMCVGVATNHLPSSFYMQRCHSQLQIKHLLQGNYSLTYFSRIRSVFSIYFVKKCFPAALHLLHVCIFHIQPWKLKWQQRNTSIKYSTSIVHCTRAQCVSLFSEETIA